MAEIHFPDEARLGSARFGSVAHVPTLFGRSDGQPATRFYCREYSRYLRERALLEWTPHGSTADDLERSGRRLSYHTRKSLRGYAERLANFDDWLVATKRDWRTVRYTEDLVLGYQADMVAGRWAKGGRKLKASTVNVRVSEACLFIRWAAERGLRGPFAPVTSLAGTSLRRGTSSQGNRRLEVHSRAGTSVRDVENALTVPSPEHMTRWLRTVRARCGYTKELMCRFTLGGALRLSEVTSFRLGDFPDPDQTPWRVVGDKMSLILTHGTKGRRLDPVNAPEAGPPRIIWIPIRLASELLNYRRLRRLRSANLFRKRSGKLPNQPADHFFLGDYDGTPIAPDTLYRAWKTEPLPMAGWHPHSARDYWACTTLQAELERQTLAAQKILEDMPGAWIEEVGRTTIDTVIRPQLGHINIKTTLRYLKWISAVGVLGKRYIDWAAYLEAADG